MTMLTDTWRGLVARRLWPVAILLLAALAAVPVLLASETEPVPVAPIASAPAATSDIAGKTIVAAAPVGSREAGRRVLGSRKNPFKPLAKVTTPEDAAKAALASTKTLTSGSATPKSSTGSSTSSGSTGSGSTGSTGGTPVTPPSTGLSPTVKKKVYEVNSLVVRFGESSAEKLNARTLVRLKALPSIANPVIIYLGILEDGKTAAFLVDASATPQGDGRCVPHPQNCQTIHLRAGETEYFDVATGEADSAGAVQTIQYQLDLVRIHKKKTRSATAARKAYAAESPEGRKAFRARAGRAGRLHYNRTTGKVIRLSDKQYKAAAARASAAAKR